MTSVVHDGHHAVSADPFMQWVMDDADAADAGGDAMAVRGRRPRVLSFVLLVAHGRRDGWAGRHFYTRAWSALRTARRT